MYFCVIGTIFHYRNVYNVYLAFLCLFFMRAKIQRFWLLRTCLVYELVSGQCMKEVQNFCNKLASLQCFLNYKYEESSLTSKFKSSKISMLSYLESNSPIHELCYVDVALYYLCVNYSNRNSHRRYSVKKGVLKNFTNLTGYNWVFPCEYGRSFKTAFL